MPKRDKVLSALGLNVRKNREAREFTQEKLSEKSGFGITSHQLGDAEFGEIVESRIVEGW